MTKPDKSLKGFCIKFYTNQGKCEEEISYLNDKRNGLENPTMAVLQAVADIIANEVSYDQPDESEEQYAKRMELLFHQKIPVDNSYEAAKPNPKLRGFARKQKKSVRLLKKKKPAVKRKKRK